MNIGERIRYFRTKAKFTQNGLAEWAGISQTHLRKVELGQSDITIGHLELICTALGITLKEFFNVENNENDDISSAISKLTPKQRALLLDFIKSM